MRFDSSRISTFRFVSFEYDETERKAKFHYAFDDSYNFAEEFVFLGAPQTLSSERRAVLDECLRHLHLAAGISYYKAAVPSSIIVEQQPLSRGTASFFDSLYFHGLAEFSYRNRLNLSARIRFPSNGVDLAPRVSRLKLRQRSIVPIGGGKDSIVSMEALRSQDKNVVLFSLGDFDAIRKVAHQAGLDRIVVHRKIDPLLFELNRSGALNGHVPISAIIAFVLSAAAVLYDFDTAVMSNERSADSPNLVWDGQKVNHQYSKSSEFELAVRHQFSLFLPGFRFFSLLRPYSELYIASIFARYRDYHNLFSSCNTSFRVSAPGTERWCLNCPKCRFVFLSLAPFLPKHDLIEIFGENLLDDKQQYEGFAGLLGLRNHKPFECVGEYDESVAALGCLADRREWRDDLLVKNFSVQLKLEAGKSRKLLTSVLREGSKRSIPKEFRKYLPPISEVLTAIDRVA